MLTRSGDDEPDRAASAGRETPRADEDRDAALTTPTVETIPEPLTDSEPAPEARKPRAPRVTAARVARTCGADGIADGPTDCYVSLRAAPTTDASERGRIDEGETVRLVCQLRGESVPSSVLGDSSRIWARTRSGAYVAGVYLEGRGLDPFRITLRRC